jgi:hypothetical protein
MKGLIYLARKDAIYHILRFSIHGFTKVLEGLRGESLGRAGLLPQVLQLFPCRLGGPYVSW